MHPFFFGTSEHRLFAVYHAAVGSRPRALGVVLCYPLGHEYIRSYRALKTLASQLASQGFHVIRFDYYGSGDSAGASDAGSVDVWVDDILTAIDELKDMAGVDRVVLLGLRLGANLAVRAASRRADIDALVLWDPVPSGSEYLAEAQAVQERWFRAKPGPKGPAARQFDGELFGFPMPESLVADLRRLDFESAVAGNSRRVAVLVSDDQQGGCDWQALVRRLGETAVYRCVSGVGEWDQPSSVNRALLPHEMIRTIVMLMTSGELWASSASGAAEPR